MTLPESPLPSPDTVAALAAVVELKSVLVNSFSAKRHREGRLDAMEVSREGSYAIEAERLLYRIIVHCGLLAEAAKTPAAATEPEAKREVLAELNVEFVCELPTRADFQAPGSDLLTQLGEQVVYPAAFPYIREAIAAMSARLGFPPITVGILRAGQEWPDTAGVPGLP